MIVIFEASVLLLLGLAVGSFLNVIILRLTSGEQWTRGRSHCVQCKAVLRVIDLIPLLSFVFLKGRCRYCNAKISWQYPLVESVTALLFVCVYFSLLFNLHLDSLFVILSSGTLFPFLLLLRNIFFLSVLLIVFVTDLRWYAIYDTVIIFGSALALACNMLLPPLFSPQYILPAWLNLVAAAAVPAVFFGLQYIISHGRWIGEGDILLGIMMGFMVGFPQVIVALFIAYCSGAIIGLLLLAIGKKNRKSEVPFGTFLTVGTAVMVLFGDSIMAYVSHLLFL